MTNYKLLMAIGFSLGTMALLTLGYSYSTNRMIYLEQQRQDNLLELLDKAHSTYGEAMRVEVFDNGVLIISQGCE